MSGGPVTWPSKADLVKVVDRLAGVRVALWGDMVLDEFLMGEVKRISREAPVLILDHLRSDYVPGGAANTAANIASLGATVSPVGVVGDDEAGRQLLSLLGARDIDVSGIEPVTGLITPIKTRVSGSGLHTTQQQIVRIDRGRPFALDATARRDLADRVGSRLESADALTVADYGYHSVEPDVVRRLAASLRADGRVSTVDSRWRLLEFRGASAVSPNEPEVEAMLGISLRHADVQTLGRAGADLLARLECDSVLMTRGSEGMAVYTREAKTPRLIPVYGTDEVADVTGAGDTVMAVYAVSLAAGASPLEAALLANYAGGLVVMKQGTATVSPRELRNALASHPDEAPA
ncbi:MAG: bifunctional heptose 7-phosphate kinase/heptose 1-phosphate adenyltransferase [Acidobacteriota bacterium]